MYNVALIGCGKISFKHIEALINNKNKMALIACCDIVEKRAKEKADDYQKKVECSKVNVYSDYKKLLEIEKPEIVLVATESGNHYKITIDALNFGANVIVEKPIALSTKHADEMIAASKKNDKKLAVCFQNRFNKPVQMAFNALQKNRFGRIFHSMIQTRWNRNEDYYKQANWRGTWEQDGGTLMNQCIHGIDLIQWLMQSPVKRVTGVTRRFNRPIEAEDFGSAILEFENGGVGIIEGSACVYPKNLCETLSLFGENGSVVIGGLAVNKLEVWRFADSDIVGDTEEKILNPKELDPPNVYGFGHTALFADFVEALENNTKPFIDGEEGKKALEIILAIYKSMKEGVKIELPIDFDTKQMKNIF